MQAGKVGLKVLLVLGLFNIASSADADTEIKQFTWTGENGNNWANAGNWAGPAGLYPDDPYDQANFGDPSNRPMPVQNAAMSNGLGQLQFHFNGWTIFLDSNQRPLRFNSGSYFDGVAIRSGGYGSPGSNVIYPRVELLNSSQVIETSTGSTLVLAGGFGGGYSPIISTAHPLADDTGAVRIDAASSTLSAPVYLRQGTLLLRHSQALGTSSQAVNIGGDIQVTDRAWARLLTDAAGVVVDKPIHVRSYSGHNVQAVLGGNQSSGNSSFTGGIQLDLDTRLTAQAGTAVTFSGAISGSGGVIKVGEGTVILSGASSYAGLTSVNEGILILRHSSGLGSSATGTTVSSAGQLQLDGAAGNLTVAEPLSLAGISQQGGSGALRNLSGANQLQGPITLTAETRITQSGGSLNLSGGIAGNYPLRLKVDAGQLTISGQPVNLGGGDLSVEGPGTVVLQVGGNQFAAARVVGGGTLRTGAASVLPEAARVILGDETTAGKLDLQGYSQTIAGLESSGSDPASEVTSVTSATLTIQTPASQESIFAGRVTGQIGLVKQGAGTQVLSGANTYTGSTTVQAGVLEIKHAQALGNTAEGTTVLAEGQLRLNPSGSGMTLAEPLILHGTTQQLGTGALVNQSGQNYLTGSVILGSATRISQWGGGLVIAGGIVGDYDLQLAVSAGELSVETNPIRLGTLAELLVTGGGTVRLGVGENLFGRLVVQGDSVVQLAAAGALPQGSSVILGDSSGTNGVLDLGGYNLEVAGLATGGGTGGMVRSSSTALLTVRNSRDYQFAGSITGNLGVTKDGPGMWILSGSSDYTGQTVVAAGQLVVASDRALGRPDQGTTVTETAQVVLAGGQSGLRIAEPFVLAGTHQARGEGALVNDRGDNEVIGGITLNDHTRITVRNGALRLSGGVTGDNRDLHLAVPGPDTQIVIAHQPINLGVGQLVVEGKAGASQGGSVKLDRVNSAHSFSALHVESNATVITASDQVLPESSRLVLGSQDGPGFVDLAGTTQRVGGLESRHWSSAIMSSKSGATLVVDAGEDIRFSGALVGPLSLVKEGPGHLALTRDFNLYTGATTVAGGTLSLLGEHTGGDVYKVLMAAVLAGSGSTTSTVDLWGTLSPGNLLTGETVGNFSVGGLNLWGGCRYEWELRNPEGNPGQPDGFDLLLVAGDVTVGASVDNPVRLQLVSAESFTGTLRVGMELPLITFTGNITGFDPRLFAIDTSRLQHSVEGPLFVTLRDNTLWLSVAPEPGSLALLASFLGAVGLGSWWRKGRHTSVPPSTDVI